MSEELKIPVTGLALDDNQNTLPAGALFQASNACIRRQGVIEPRRGFNKLATLPFAAADLVTHMFSFDGQLYAVDRVSAVLIGLSRWDGASWTSVSLPAVTVYSQSTSAYRQRTQLARRSLYLAQGVFGQAVPLPLPMMAKLTSATASGMPAGIASPGIPFGLTAVAGGVAVDPSTTVAYRSVLRHTDANGLVVRSAPSSRVYFSNTTVAAVDVQMVVSSTGFGSGVYLAAGDVLELYRSNPITGVTSVIPDDEMALCAEHVLTAGESAVAAATMTDRCSTTGRGAALYTNSTQEGILQANKRPPLCEDVALFADCMFFAQAAQDSRGSIIITDVTQANGFNYHNNAGVNFAGTSALANPTITAIASTADFSVGQLVIQVGQVPGGAGAAIPSNARIISKTATTITLDKNCTAAGAVSFTACDVIRVDNLDYFAFNAEASGAFPSFFANLYGAGAITARRMAESFASIVSATSGRVRPYVVTDATTQAGWAFEKDTIGSTPGLEVKSHKDAAANAALQAFVPVERPNALMWSKPLEPEHVPDVNYAAVGSEKNVIRRIIALRDGLLIWSDEGLWRLTGVFPDFRIDCIDRTLTLSGFNTPAVMNDVCFAFTNRGVVMATVSGAEIASDPVWQALKPAAFALGDYTTLTALDAFGFVNENEYEYYLKLPAVTNPLLNAYTDPVMWVYNGRTASWTTWSVNVESGVTHSDRLTYLGYADGSDNNVIRKERRVKQSSTLAFLDYADDDIAMGGVPTVTAINTTTLTITMSLSFTLLSGDAIVIGGNYFKVVANNGGGNTAQLNTVTGIAVTNAITAAYRGYLMSLIWQPMAANNPGALKQWREVGIVFDKRLNQSRFEVKMWNDWQASSTDSRVITATAATGDATQPAVNSQTMRILCGRQSGRGRILRFEYDNREALVELAIGGLSVVYEDMDTRTRRVNTFA